jgi:hypothetical protein
MYGLISQRKLKFSRPIIKIIQSWGLS